MPWHCLHISEFEPNIFQDWHLDTFSFFYFSSKFCICHSLGRCVFEVICMLQKSQRPSALNWVSLRLPVSHYICLWAAVFCGQIWSSYFKLVYSTIWRNSFQPKHLINSELRWPCLCFATCKSWTQWQNKDKCTSILDQVSASSHPIMTTPDLIFTTLSHPISFHSTLWQSMKTWRKKKIYTHK